MVGVGDMGAIRLAKAVSMYVLYCIVLTPSFQYRIEEVKVIKNFLRDRFSLFAFLIIRSESRGTLSI